MKNVKNWSSQQQILLNQCKAPTLQFFLGFNGKEALEEKILKLANSGSNVTYISHWDVFTCFHLFIFLFILEIFASISFWYVFSFILRLLWSVSAWAMYFLSLRHSSPLGIWLKNPYWGCIVGFISFFKSRKAMFLLSMHLHLSLFFPPFTSQINISLYTHKKDSKVLRKELVFIASNYKFKQHIMM